MTYLNLNQIKFNQTIEISPTALQDGEKEQIFTTQLNKFMLAYKDLESEKKEYKIYFSIFKRKPSRKQFNDLLESEDFINSFSNKMYYSCYLK